MAQVGDVLLNMCLVLSLHDRQHDNTNPITKEPLKPADLITLHYSRKATGEIHDPISFKPFSEHSHIVAIATTGNVFLSESIKEGRDLVGDVKFKKYATRSRVICLILIVHAFREDVITLQNPHGMPSSSIPSAIATAAISIDKSKTVATKPPAGGSTLPSKPKETVPCASSCFCSIQVRSFNLYRRECLALFHRNAGRVFDLNIYRPSVVDVQTCLG